MTLEEAKSNIGKPFKIMGFAGGAAGGFDTIRSVEENGMIHGDFIQALAEDCRLKQEQPEGFKRSMIPDQQFKDLYTDANGMCFSDADPGL